MEVNNNTVTQIYDILGESYKKLDVTIEFLYTEIKNSSATPSQILVFENVCEAALKIIDSQREVLNFSEDYIKEFLLEKLDEKEMQIRDALLNVISNRTK